MWIIKASKKKEVFQSTDDLESVVIVERSVVVGLFVHV